MPGAWRAVAGAVAEGTTPINAVGDSLLRMPVATWMLMDLAVFSGNLVGDGDGFQSPAGDMIARAFWFRQEALSRAASFESRGEILPG